MQGNPSAAGAPPLTLLGELIVLPQAPYLLGGRLAAPSPSTPALLSALLASPLLFPHSKIVPLSKVPPLDSGWRRP